MKCLVKQLTFSRLKIWQRVALVLLLYPASVFLAVLSTGELHLRNVKQTLAAEGVLRPLNEVLPPPSNEEAENAQRLLSVSRPLNDLQIAYEAIRNGQELMMMVEPGFAVSGLRGTSPLYINYRVDEKAPKDWDELRNHVAEGATVLAESAVWLHQPVALDFDRLQGVDIQQLHRLFVWFKASAVLNLRDGNLPAAIDDLTTIQRYSFFTRRSGHFIERHFWSSIVLAPVWEILQTGVASDADLNRVHELIQSSNLLAISLAEMSVEIAKLPEYPQYYYEERWNLGIAQELFDSTPVLAVRDAFWGAFRQKRELAFSLNEAAIGIKESKDILSKRNWQKRNFSPPLTRDPGSCSLTLYEEVRIRSISFILARETARQLAIAAIALERYRLKYGAYPATLDALMSDFVAELPHDWFDGRPLKYRHLAPNRFVLYSVGEDGIDNGGDPTPVPPSKDYAITSGRDLVWPRLKE